MQDDTLPTGIPGLDALMGGFRIGDNVLLQLEVGTPSQPFTRAFLAEALRRGDRVFHVAFDHSPATVVEWLSGLPDGELTLVDAFTYGKGRGEEVFRRFYERPPPPGVHVVPVDTPNYPSAFHRVFDELAAGDARDFLVVDSLTGMTELWRSEDRVREFYTHTCPRLFDTRAVAVWTLGTRVHTEAFRATIGHVAQVVLDLGRDGDATTLRVERAVGRSRPGLHRPRRYEETPGGVLVHGDP